MSSEIGAITLKIMLYPYVDVGRISHSFSDNLLEIHLGIRLNGMTSLPGRLPPPVVVEVPPGSVFQGKPLRWKWVGHDCTHVSDADEVLKYATYQVFGFRLVETHQDT